MESGNTRFGISTDTYGLSRNPSRTYALKSGAENRWNCEFRAHLRVQPRLTCVFLDCRVSTHPYELYLMRIQFRDPLD
jgi:hypothetical protein